MALFFFFAIFLSNNSIIIACPYFGNPSMTLVSRCIYLKAKRGVSVTLGTRSLMTSLFSVGVVPEMVRIAQDRVIFLRSEDYNKKTSLQLRGPLPF